MTQQDLPSLDPKSPWQSMTLWGLLMILVTGLVDRLVPAANRSQVIDLVGFVLKWILGPGLVIYGRWRAKQPLTLAGQAKTAPVIIIGLLFVVGCSGTLWEQSWPDDSKTLVLRFTAFQSEKFGADVIRVPGRLAATQPATQPTTRPATRPATMPAERGPATTQPTIIIRLHNVDIEPQGGQAVSFFEALAKFFEFLP